MAQMTGRLFVCLISVLVDYRRWTVQPISLLLTPAQVHHLAQSQRSDHHTILQGYYEQYLLESQLRFSFRGACVLDCHTRTCNSAVVRRHVALCGTPVVGDQDYGACSGQGELAMHTWQLGFVHPETRRRIVCVAPPGTAFRESAAALGLWGWEDSVGFQADGGVEVVAGDLWGESQ